MDAFLGSWKLLHDKNEGITLEYGAALGISAENFAMFEKMRFTMVIAKADGDCYTYTYNIEGLPEPVVVGPWKLGEKFDYYDKWDKRTEENVFTVEGGKVVEKSTIKEDPKYNWVTTRSVDGDSMRLECVSGSRVAKQYFTKV